MRKLSISQKISVAMVSVAMPVAVIGVILNPTPLGFAGAAMSVVCGAIVYIMADLL